MWRCFGGGRSPRSCQGAVSTVLVCGLLWCCIPWPQAAVSPTHRGDRGAAGIVRGRAEESCPSVLRAWESCSLQAAGLWGSAVFPDCVPSPNCGSGYFWLAAAGQAPAALLSHSWSLGWPSVLRWQPDLLWQLPAPGMSIPPRGDSQTWCGSSWSLGCPSLLRWQPDLAQQLPAPRPLAVPGSSPALPASSFPGSLWHRAGHVNKY